MRCWVDAWPDSAAARHFQLDGVVQLRRRWCTPRPVDQIPEPTPRSTRSHRSPSCGSAIQFRCCRRSTRASSPYARPRLSRARFDSRQLGKAARPTGPKATHAHRRRRPTRPRSVATTSGRVSCPIEGSRTSAVGGRCGHDRRHSGRVLDRSWSRWSATRRICGFSLDPHQPATREIGGEGAPVVGIALNFWRTPDDTCVVSSRRGGHRANLRLSQCFSIQSALTTHNGGCPCRCISALVGPRSAIVCRS